MAGMVEMVGVVAAQVIVIRGDEGVVVDEEVAAAVEDEFFRCRRRFALSFFPVVVTSVASKGGRRNTGDFEPLHVVRRVAVDDVQLGCGEEMVG